MFHVKHDEEPGAAAVAVFGDRLPLVLRYAELLRDTGVSHGLIGPREGERLWDRHLLNCAVLAEIIEPDARVLDLGSGAGLPGIPLALARPDLEVVLLEPLARRVSWLERTVAELGVDIVVSRGRSEDPGVRKKWRGADVVTARAVAPLHRLAGWALPLLRPGGRLLAMKGETAADEVDRDRDLVARFGGAPPVVVQCGEHHVDPPTTVVTVERRVPGSGFRTATGKSRPRGGNRQTPGGH
jgi:16S rRNA (guanine527-N7)-methyltransferase